MGMPQGISCMESYGLYWAISFHLLQISLMYETLDIHLFFLALFEGTIKKSNFLCTE